MTMYNNPYGTQPAYTAPAQNQMEGGELQDGSTYSAADLGDYDKGYVLLPEGDYSFTVVNLETKRYQPGPKSTGKIGPCKQIVLKLRVINPEDGEQVDLDHNLFMWNSRACTGMIAQFYDSIGNHRKGEPLTFDWRPEVIIGKTGYLKVNHRIHQDDRNKPVDEQRRYNNIQRLYPKDSVPASAVPNAQNNTPAWQSGNF
ncbi:MAG: hypothetical protein IJH14_06610 [Solobacterium sp.]|nr:hypothetical protein [Solobacterium sp.]